MKFKLQTEVAPITPADPATWRDLTWPRMPAHKTFAGADGTEPVVVLARRVLDAIESGDVDRASRDDLVQMVHWLVPRIARREWLLYAVVKSAHFDTMVDTLNIDLAREAPIHRKKIADRRRLDSQRREAEKRRQLVRKILVDHGGKIDNKSLERTLAREHGITASVATLKRDRAVIAGRRKSS